MNPWCETKTRTLRRNKHSLILQNELQVWRVITSKINKFLPAQ